MYAQSCLTLCNPMYWSSPGSSVHGIFQARTLEQVAISYSRGSSRPRDQTCVSCASCIGRRILYHWATWEVPPALRVDFSQCLCSTLSFRSSLCTCASVHTLPQPCCWMLAHLVVGSRGVLCCLGSASALGRPCCREPGEWIYLGEPATSYGLDQNFRPLPQPKRVVLFFFHSVSAALGVTEFAHFPGV